MNPNSEVFGWAILVATFVGPIAAVIITRWIDAAREKTQRRLVIFRTLMATRAVGLNPERVAALNMIQIDFANTPPVVNAWHDLLAHYGLARPANDQERQALIENGPASRQFCWIKWPRNYGSILINSTFWTGYTTPRALRT